MAVSKEASELYELCESVVVYSDERMLAVDSDTIRKILSTLFSTDLSLIKSDLYELFHLSQVEMERLQNWKRNIAHFLIDMDGIVSNFPNDLPMGAEEYFTEGWNDINDGFYILFDCYERKIRQMM